MKVAVLGAGNVGKRLASLLLHAGHEVYVGLHDLSKKPDLDGVESGRMEDAASKAEVVMLAVPFTAYQELLPKIQTQLEGKIVVDVSNPLNADWSPLLLGEQNSAGETVAKLLPKSHVVKAFNTVFADVMTKERLTRDGMKVSAFIAADETHPYEVVSSLAGQMGFNPVVVGPLRCARYLEAMAHLNIQIAVGMEGGTNAAFIYHVGA